MARKLRLDTVVGLREREEQKAREALGVAVQATRRAEEALAEAEARARRDERGRGPVELWVMQEAAHERALQDVKACRAKLDEARKAEAAARAQQVLAYQRAEVVRRVAAARRAELDAADLRAENKAMDEFAAVKHLGRQRASDGSGE